MNKKNWIIIGGVVALGGVVFLYIQNRKRIKENEELKKSVDDLTKKYQVFN